MNSPDFRMQQEQQEYEEQQEALPEHKRDGWAEKQHEIADYYREEQNERL
jgi:hypothetical protein